MAFCESCGHELSAGAKFCSECGVAVGPSASSRNGSGQAVHKCPQCGERIDAFVARCPSCGYELRDSQTLSRVRELEDDLEGIESPKRRSELIRNFFIPNTKEDIYEFVILASSNLKAGGSDDAAWSAKLEQAIQKAELVFGDGPELNRLKRMRKSTSGTGLLRKAFNVVAGSKVLQALILFVVGAAFFAIGEAMNSMISMIGLFPVFGGMALLMPPSDGEKGE